MTETSPVIAFNRFAPEEPGLGPSASPYLAGTPDRRSGGGRGRNPGQRPNVMMGYYNRRQRPPLFLPKTAGCAPAISANSLQAFPAITGRRKDIFKTSGGKYIALRNWKMHSSHRPILKNAWRWGFSALSPQLVMPNLTCSRAGVKNMTFTGRLQFMVHNHKVAQFMEEEVKGSTRPASAYKRIRAFHLLTNPGRRRPES